MAVVVPTDNPMPEAMGRAQELEAVWSAEQRFWAKVAQGDKDECWVWQGALNSQGYGNFAVHRRPNLYRGAHRISWVLAHGELIPEGMCVLHACDNPPCCNPSHLRLGSHRENAEDKLRKGRGRVGVGERHGNCKLSDEEVDTLRSDIELGHSYSEAARKFHISPQHARSIALGIWRARCK